MSKATDKVNSRVAVLEAELVDLQAKVQSVESALASLKKLVKNVEKLPLDEQDALFSLIC